MPVIAAIDRSGRADSVIGQAKRMADDANVDLHVVHVGEPELPHPTGGYDPERAEFISERKAAAIARDSGEAVLGGNEFEAVGLQGDTAGELLRYASEQDAEYIVLSARKRTPLGQAVFGSVSQSVLLNAECPVVAAPHDTE